MSTKRLLLVGSIVLLLVVSAGLIQMIGNNTPEQTVSDEATVHDDELNRDGNEQEGYENPVFEPVFADPSIIRADDGYIYAYGTEDDWGDGQGMKYMPIIRSTNLVDWEYVGDVFETKPTWKADGWLWAPDIAYFNDRYYLYYSQSTWGDPNPGIGIAIADDPAGPFEDQGKLFLSDEIGVANSIDPMFYVDDGTPYLFWGSFHGIYGIELAEDGMATVGEKFQIASSLFEAAYIIERDDYYYFFGSVGSCCEGADSSYHVSVGRAESIEGPYVNDHGDNLVDRWGTLVVRGDDDPQENGTQFVGPGHNSILTDDDGTDWLVYHAIDADNDQLPNGASRRPLMIDPLIWEDGWPKVEGLTPSVHHDHRPVFEQ